MSVIFYQSVNPILDIVCCNVVRVWRLTGLRQSGIDPKKGQTSDKHRTGGVPSKVSRFQRFEHSGCLKIRGLEVLFIRFNF